VIRVLGLLALCAALARPAVADIEDSHFTSKRWGVAIDAPRNWTLSERTSYPNILLWMARQSPPEGKMLLTAEKLPRRTSDSLTYARQTRIVLRQMGFTVRAPQLHSVTGAYWVDFDDGSSFLRQAYLTKGGVGFTLTLAAPTSRIRNQHLRAFDASLRSLSFIEIEADPDGESQPTPPPASEPPSP